MERHILDLLPHEFEQYITGINEKKFRVKQVYEWIFRKGVLDFAQMTSLSASLRERLSRDFNSFLPEIKNKACSQDGTTKYLLGLADGNSIEMVLIPAGKKNTLCVSSQVGCVRNCKFCATATLGFKRSLEPYEIVSQVYLAVKELGEQKLTNIVFMGMGEPLDNLKNVIKAIRLLQHDLGFSFSPRRITISTCGVIPKIRELAESGLKVKLAVSLNAAISEKREILMPVTKVYPLDELKKALLDFRKKTSFRVTFEYVTIKDFNMGPEDVKALIKFLGDISCKLNVIAWNEVESLPYKSPSEEEIREFISKLEVLSAAITLRKSRGSDIHAACGQLAAKEKVGKLK